MYYRGPTAPNSSKKSSHNKSDSTSTIHLDDPSKPTKYTVPYHEIVDRVKFIITAQKHRRSVPDYIIEYLKKSIADRGKCTAWFCKHKVGDILVERSTEDHVRFTGVLKDVLAMLELPSVPPDAGISYRLTDDEPAKAGHRFSRLNVEDPKSVAETSGVTDNLSVQGPEELEPQSSNTDEVYKAPSTDEDRLIAMYDLLERLQKTRKGIQETWSMYREKNISLINATAVTNAAIELAHSWEDRFRIDFPESPYWDELIEILFPDITDHWQAEPSAWVEQDVEDLESIFYFTTQILRDFQHTCNASDFCNWIKIWTPKVNRVYDPREDVFKLNPVQKLVRSKTLMDNVLPELLLQARHNIIPVRDKLTDAFKHMLNTRHVYLYIAFVFQVLCDIHLVLGEQVFRPFADLKAVGTRLLRHRDTIIKPLQERTQAYHETLQFHQMLVDRHNGLMDGQMLRWRQSYYRDIINHEYEAQGQKPHFLITHQTLLCGSITASTCVIMQETSIRLADNLYYVTAVLHLHNALKKEGCISAPIPILEALEQLYEPGNVFLGQAPSEPQKYRNHYFVILGFSLKCFATGKTRKGDTKRKNDKTRPKDLTALRPVMKALKNEFCAPKENPSPSFSDLIRLVEEKKPAPPQRRSSYLKTSPSPQQDINADPAAFLASLRDRIEEEQPRLDASYYNAYITCYRLLQHILTSKSVKKRFCKQYHLDRKNDDPLTKLHWVPQFLFERHLEDPDGKWLASAGETVEKFFSTYEMGVEDLRKGCWPKEGEEEHLDCMDLAMGIGEEGYGGGGKKGKGGGNGGKWEIDEKWHPTKEGRCYHVGVCEVMVREWRRRAGLEAVEDEGEEEEVVEEQEESNEGEREIEEEEEEEEEEGTSSDDDGDDGVER